MKVFSNKLATVILTAGIFTCSTSFAMPVNPPPTPETFINQTRCGGYAAFLTKDANLAQYQSHMYKYIQRAKTTALALNEGMSEAEAVLTATSEVSRQLGWEQANAFYAGDAQQHTAHLIEQYTAECI
ncbi:hypothetical protein A9264_08850 [Vibrio sp. UCD-FRSSP16_10]|uniref:hypothetical protein n=1 Tax=unclassified Vibrio TaxID=2614977 RepID=UPI0007FDB6A1|nr:MULTISPECIES: hypothetical protein [unclassified Vibrio]OBT09371.1 hypothetical protein A9260_05950 [Vibrio sp. UCD-FRSSP16_30]OBT22051.1 hypothetical protein A9264_08850 [Vibrio sp. UCD-FRSSP16_10]